MYKQLTQTAFYRSNRHWRPLFIAGTLLFVSFTSRAAINWYVPNPDYSIARNWNERALEGIRMDTPHPPGQARNLFSFSVCMYDAWAAYDSNAVGFVYRGKHTAPDVAAARREAISYAMYRMMLERHSYSRTATNQAGANPVFMSLLGYDTNNRKQHLRRRLRVVHQRWVEANQRYRISRHQSARSLPGLSHGQSATL